MTFLNHPNLKPFPGLEQVFFIKDQDQKTIGYLMTCKDQSIAVLNTEGELITYAGSISLGLLVPIDEIINILLTEKRQPQSKDGWEAVECMDQDEDQAEFLV